MSRAVGSAAGAGPVAVPQHLRQAAPLLRLAPRGLAYAIASPRVLKNYRRLLVPTVTATLVLRLLAFILLLPIKVVLILLWMISLGMLPGMGAIENAMNGVSQEAVNLAPFLVMEVFRSVYSKSLSKCFFETFQVVNPDVGSRLPELRPLPKGKGETIDPNAPRLQKILAFFQGNKALTIMLISLSIRLWRNLPIIGALAVPMSNFLLLWKLLPVPHAAVMASLCILPPITPVAFRAAELYRGGRVLSELLMAPYLRRVIPFNERDKFLRRNEFALLAFGVPFYFLMNVPFLGPLVFIMAQAAAAVLCDHVVKSEGFPVKTVVNLSVAHQ